MQMLLNIKREKKKKQRTKELEFKFNGKCKGKKQTTSTNQCSMVWDIAFFDITFSIINLSTALHQLSKLTAR